MRHQNWNISIVENVLRYAAKYQLAQAAMREGTFDQEIGRK